MASLGAQVALWSRSVQRGYPLVALWRTISALEPVGGDGMSQTADRSSQDVPLRGGSVSPRRLLGALREITLAAMHAHTPTEVALVAATQVCQLMECDEAVVRWWNPERASLELLADTRHERTGRGGARAGGVGAGRTGP